MPQDICIAKHLGGTFTHVSEWYHSLQEDHSIQFESGNSGMRQTQYIGISSTIFTLEPMRLVGAQGT